MAGAEVGHQIQVPKRPFAAYPPLRTNRSFRKPSRPPVIVAPQHRGRNDPSRDEPPLIELVGGIVTDFRKYEYTAKNTSFRRAKERSLSVKVTLGGPPSADTALLH